MRSCQSRENAARSAVLEQGTNTRIMLVCESIRFFVEKFVDGLHVQSPLAGATHFGCAWQLYACPQVVWLRPCIALRTAPVRDPERTRQ